MAADKNKGLRSFQPVINVQHPSQTIFTHPFTYTSQKFRQNQRFESN